MEQRSKEYWQDFFPTGSIQSSNRGVVQLVPGTPSFQSPSGKPYITICIGAREFFGDAGKPQGAQMPFMFQSEADEATMWRMFERELLFYSDGAELIYVRVWPTMVTNEFYDEREERLVREKQIFARMSFEKLKVEVKVA